jgi:hypothetical protein
MLTTSRINGEKPDIISGITDIVETFRRNVFTTICWNVFTTICRNVFTECFSIAKLDQGRFI